MRRLKQHHLLALQGPAHVFEAAQKICVAIFVSDLAQAFLDVVGVPHLDAGIELAFTEIKDREELISWPVDTSLEQPTQALDPIA
jgi:hypothetical protein